MNAEGLFIISIVLLAGGWFYWFRERKVPRLGVKRKFFAWLGLVALTLAVLMFGVYLMLVERTESTNQPFITRLELLLPLVRIGFVFANGAIVGCSFSTGKSRVCLAISSGVIWILWLAQVIGV